MAGVSSNINSAKNTFVSFMVIGLVGLLFLIVFGNLSGNLGFASGSQGDNDTTAVINNLTGGATTFFSFSNVWFTLMAVTLLIVIVVGVIGYVVSGTKGSGFSS